MTAKRSNPTRDEAASKLREHIWSAAEGDLLGSEDDLIQLLGVSRNTVRQVARLIEREGLLRVKRGNNGGYFAARPSAEIIESSVSAYLQMLDADDEEATEIASILWIYSVRKACRMVPEGTRAFAEEMREQVSAIPEEAGFDEILAVEEAGRSRLFKLNNSPYVELIFHINRTFAQRHFPSVPAEMDGTPAHRDFVRQWKKAKLLELDAIADGDIELGQLAASRSRRLFHERLWGRRD